MAFTVDCKKVQLEHIIAVVLCSLHSVGSTFLTTICNLIKYTLCFPNVVQYCIMLSCHFMLPDILIIVNDLLSQMIQAGYGNISTFDETCYISS